MTRVQEIELLQLQQTADSFNLDLSGISDIEFISLQDAEMLGLSIEEPNETN